MSKTIEQLAILAAQIEEATRQGENTALRVGGLFSDIVDYLATLHLNDITLGPLLTSLNNSGLLEPSDGQTLAFSIMDDKWKYSDAITQLKLSIRGIEQTVASNYRAFLQVKDELEAQVNATDQRVREYKTEYDQSQIEYATWKSQTDTSISQYATAIDKVTGDIISISGRVDTAYDQLDFVTNDLEAADKAIGKIFDLAGMDLSDEPSASWLYKNKDGIYGAAATFDEEGNLKQYSKLSVTVNGIEQKAESADGKVTLISQTVDGIQQEVSDATGRLTRVEQDIDSISSTVASDEANIKTLTDAVNGTPGNPGILSRLGSAEGSINNYADAVSYIQQNRDSITATVGYFDSDGKLISTAGLVTRGDFSGLFVEKMGQEGVVTNANMSVYLKKIINSEGVENMISVAEIEADQIQMTGDQFRGWFNDYIDLTADMIKFNFTKSTDFTSGGHTVMRIEPDGDLLISGTLVSNADIDGIRTSDDGNIERYNPNLGWIPMFASRAVRYIASGATLTKNDDYIIAGNGTYSVYLPTGVQDGKVITIKNLWDGIYIRTQGTARIVVNDPGAATDVKDLDNFDRAELVYYQNIWYWNYLET